MLASLKASLPQDLSYEVIFADDSSTDETRTWLASLDDERVQFILNERNYGYAKTNNLALQCAKGHYLGMLNNDLLFEPGWFEPMLAALEAPSLSAGIVGNVQFRVADKALDHAGVALMPSGKFEHLQGPLDVNASATPVYAVTGACMLVRRADFEAAGGFDETFVNGCEDIDLCIKVRQAGKQIYVTHSSQILHHVSLSRSRVSLQNEKNSKYLYSKWRKEIKLQLTKCWVELLLKPEGNYESYIDGELTQSFKSKHHTAAMTISEAALLREEARWERDLGMSSILNGWQNHVIFKGVTEVPQLKTYLADSEVVVSIDHIKTARNFYVCARLLEDFDPASFVIELSVNGAQSKSFRLQEGSVINVGIINPLISPSSKNQLKAKIYFVDSNGVPVKPAPKVMLISHFVIDDEVVKPRLLG
jgi:GT2 family glycosyltransferase